MKFNGRLNTATRRLLQDLDDSYDSMKLVIMIFSHNGFHTAALQSHKTHPHSSFGHLNDGQGVWRFTDKEKGIKVIRRHAKKIPINFDA
ncbi:MULTISPECIES: hypothetical protein [Acinetobacter]|jgi:hypothetical protein|nr:MULTISPECIES: hypothetical protein [Acinetobacter]MDG9798725.1 hypothetical protein [Acinetobacter johnsonii]